MVPDNFFDRKQTSVDVQPARSCTSLRRGPGDEASGLMAVISLRGGSSLTSLEPTMALDSLSVASKNEVLEARVQKLNRARVETSLRSE